MAPQGTPQYSAPEQSTAAYVTPQYGASQPQFGTPQYATPQVSAALGNAPQSAAPTGAPPTSIPLYGSAPSATTTPTYGSPATTTPTYGSPATTPTYPAPAAYGAPAPTYGSPSALPPTYGAPPTYGNQPATPVYGMPAPQAPGYTPAGYAAPPSYTPAYPTGPYGPRATPPQQYGPPASPGGYYAHPGASPYPPTLPPAKKGGIGKWLIILVAVLVVVGVAIPVITSLTTPQYMNQNYKAPAPDTNPPGLPSIPSETAAQQIITANQLYNQKIPLPTNCSVATIDLTTAPETQLMDHMSAVIACLMRVWDGNVTNAGYTMPRPPLVIYSSPISTGCGRLTTMNAAYCSADQKVYYATDLPKTIPTDLRNSRFVVEMVVAHEFGHAVQARTGILAAGHGFEDRAGSDAVSQEWSRRIELQADCFGGLFIHSVAKSAGMTQQDLDNIAALMMAFGDDALSNNSTVDGGHGTGASRKYWAQLGLASTSVGVCNTFAAPSEEVR